jgi:tetratricopeptide (TPR) repeat protein
MTQHQDARGLAATLSQPAALEPYERALRAFQTYRGDPLKPLDEAIALDAGFAAAYATKALLLTTLFERRFMREALATLDQGSRALERGNVRERALAAAARSIAEGRWHEGVRMLDHVLAEYPRDIVALQAAHLMDFYRGDALNLRNRVSRVLHAWDRALPGYAYVLGMHAFGYEESNQYPEAERAGRRAVELSGDDSWAVHAVGHVMEMQGRISEGFAWYRETQPVWDTADNGFAFHNAWHTALYHLDRGETRRALEIYDARFGKGLDMVLPRIDASAMLWRLKLEGVDVAARAAPVADAWQSALEGEGGFYAFNDFHATLAFAAAGRREALVRVQAAQSRAAIERGDNAAMARNVGLQAGEAIAAYSEGRFQAAVQHLAAVRDGANRFGGSHAQRDLLTLTLIDAASRAGLDSTARHYARERLVHKPDSAWGGRLMERIETRTTRRAA